MITRETLLAARRLEPQWSTHFATSPTAPGWVTSGDFAALTTEAPEDQVSSPQSMRASAIFGDSVKAWSSGEHRVPVTEDRPMRRAGTPGRAEVSTPCDKCAGSGECAGCPCGVTHDCGSCDGCGVHVQVPYISEGLGRAVYRSSDGAWTVVSDKLARLLDGYTLYRFTGEGAAHPRPAAETPAQAASLMPIIGCDASGAVVVCVMPLRATEDDLKDAVSTPGDLAMDALEHLAVRS